MDPDVIIANLNQISSGKNTVSPVLWAYASPDDIQAVLTNGYFNDAQDGYENANGRFKLGDLIIVNTATGVFTLRIRTLGVDVEVELVSAQTQLVPKFYGSYTWAGGLATATADLTGIGVQASDLVIASIQSAPTEAAYLVSAEPGLDVVNFTLSAANTSNDAVISFVVVSSFLPIP